MPLVHSFGGPNTAVIFVRISTRCLSCSTALIELLVGNCSCQLCKLEIVFRKSDVEWKGTSRGWELMLSHSFEKNITSGYVRAMGSFKFQIILDDLQACGKPVSHPLLLPVLVLCHELSSTNDEKQRKQRRRLRRLENALSQRYEMTAAAHFGPETDPELDGVSRELADCQCEVLQKRPQAWQNVVKTTQAALQFFWQQIPEQEKTPALTDLHQTLESRLAFLTIKLEGVENYAHVTLERLSIHREVVSIAILYMLPLGRAMMHLRLPLISVLA